MKLQTIKPPLPAHPFLEGMKPEHLEILAECSMPVQFAPGEWIFRQKDPANRFYLIHAGKVALESSLQDREPVLIETIGAGDVLGWSWLMPPYYGHFDARVLEATRATFFYGTRLRNRCEKDSRLGYELFKRVTAVMLERLLATQRQLREAFELAR